MSKELAISDRAMLQSEKEIFRPGSAYQMVFYKNSEHHSLWDDDADATAQMR